MSGSKIFMCALGFVLCHVDLSMGQNLTKYPIASSIRQNYGAIRVISTGKSPAVALEINIDGSRRYNFVNEFTRKIASRIQQISAFGEIDFEVRSKSSKEAVYPQVDADFRNIQMVDGGRLALLQQQARQPRQRKHMLARVGAVECENCDGTGVMGLDGVTSLESRCVFCDGHGILRIGRFENSKFRESESGPWEKYSIGIPRSYFLDRDITVGTRFPMAYDDDYHEQLKRIKDNNDKKRIKLLGFDPIKKRDAAEVVAVKILDGLKQESRTIQMASADQPVGLNQTRRFFSSRDRKSSATAIDAILRMFYSGPIVPNSPIGDEAFWLHVLKDQDNLKTTLRRSCTSNGRLIECNEQEFSVVYKENVTYLNSNRRIWKSRRVCRYTFDRSGVYCTEIEALEEFTFAAAQGEIIDRYHSKIYDPGISLENLNLTLLETELP